MKKTEEINELLDFYEALLTEKQQDIMNMYYRDDFSLTEIAEETETSRSAVHDLIKRCENILNDYEEKLHLVKKYRERSQIYDKIKLISNQQAVIELVNKCFDTE